MSIGKKAVILGFVLYFLGFGGTAYGQELIPTPSMDEVNAIAKNMYCPVCENIPLDACGTVACENWRQQIYDLLVEGYTEEEIYEYFVLQYGDRVLAEPPRRGWNWLVYLLPPAIFFLAAFYLFRYLLRPKGVGDGELLEGAAVQTVDEEYRSKLENALKARDE